MGMRMWTSDVGLICCTPMIVDHWSAARGMQYAAPSIHVLMPTAWAGGHENMDE